MGTFLALLSKDMRSEGRSLGLCLLMLILPFLLSSVVALAIQSSFLEQRQTLALCPALVWVVFLFAATIVVERVLEPDMQHRAWEALLLSGIPLAWLYLAKLVFVTLLSFAGFVVASLSVVGLLAQPLSFSCAWWLIGLCSAFAYSSLALLVSVLSYTSRLKGMLLPALLLPLLFPVLLSAIELSATTWSGDSVCSSPWLNVLLALDLLYPALGCLLFEKCFQD